MDIGRASARGDRRRRVLTEELLAASADDQHEDPERRKTRPTGHRPRYGEAALRAVRPRLTDIVPQRPVAVLATLLLLASCVATVVSVDVASFRPTALKPAGTALRAEAAIGGGATAGARLAAWYASSMLLLAACAALIVFTVRRHRLDDYHARYRIWLWVAAGCLLLSAETAAGVLRPACDTLSRITGWHGSGQWTWIAPMVLLAVVVGLRLLLEVRECRAALACLLLATAGPVIGVTAPGDVLTWNSTVDAHVAGYAISMSACGSLLLAFLLYARYVVLEADGRAGASPPGASSAAPEPTAVRTSASRRAPPSSDRAHAGRRSASAVDTADAAGDGPPHRGGSRRPASPKRRVTRWTDGSDGADESYDDDDQDAMRRKQKLSKSERKRLRKLKQQTRRAA